MPGIALVASERDRPFADAIRSALSGRNHEVRICTSLPQTQDELVVLVWSAALEAAHGADGQALVGLWSENRLVVARRDAAPLPLGLRDLPSLPPGSGPKDVSESIESIIFGNAPKFSRASPQEPAAPSGLSQKSRFGTYLVVFALLVLSVGLGGYYYLAADQRARNATLMTMLETASKAAEELKQAQARQIDALKALEQLRAAEEAARKSGDAAKLKEAQDAAKRAEVAVQALAELVRQREAQAAVAREAAKRTAESAKAATKSAPAAVAKAEMPKAEAPKAAVAKAEAPKIETAKAAALPSKAKSRSEREGTKEEEMARKSYSPPTPSVLSVPPVAPTAENDALFQQARVLEIGGQTAEAVRLYRRAARAGHGKAAKRLGDIYAIGIPGVPRDYQESLSWYETARALGETVETAAPTSPPAAVPPPVGEPTRPPAVEAKAEPVAVAPKSAPAAPTGSGPPYELILAIAILVLAAAVWRRSSTRHAQTAQPAPTAPTAPAQAGAALLFVSYSHKDKAKIEPIVSLIEQMGRNVWMDRTGITGQAGWAGQIVRAIRDSRAVVLMASPNSYASDQVVRELYLAMNNKKPIVPIEIEPADLPDELQYLLAPFQHHRLGAGTTHEMLGRALAAV